MVKGPSRLVFGCSGLGEPAPTGATLVGAVDQNNTILLCPVDYTAVVYA